MFRWCALSAFVVCAGNLLGATFGTSFSLVGGAADLVLDEPRGRLYLVNTALSRVEVYSVAQKRLLTPITTDSSPLSAAMSRSGRYLYVASYDSSSLNIIDLESQTVSSRVSLPARPEGVAVGSDERVLISTVGTGAGNATSVLLLYTPKAGAATVDSIPITPAAAGAPVFPAPSGRPFLSVRSQLAASRNGAIIAGVNVPATGNTRIVFVYEVASASILASRVVTNSSTVLAVSADGSRILAGNLLFNVPTLEVLAQQNVANVPYPMATNVSFTTQANQGGAVFAPTGSTLYAAYNIVPVQSPAARSNTSQLMSADPDNLLVSLGLQLPENMSGKMVISADGGSLYALSESGFTTIPLSTLSQQPVITADSTAAAVAYDQCGATAALRTARITLRNAGRGNFTATALGVQNGVVANVAGAPTASVRTTQDGLAVDFTANSTQAARSLGTVTADFMVQSTQAVNIPPQIRVFQNSRNAEARGDLYPIPLGIAATSIQDLAYDSTRQRLYLANAGLNRIDIFDIRTKAFLTPLKTGQLPVSLALSPDAATLYVACAGGEVIQIVDVAKLQVAARVRFPALPLNSATAILSPSVIAAHEGGAIFITSTGQLWDVTGTDAVPRGASAVIGKTTAGAPLTMTSPVTLAASPGGERVLLLNGNGYVYLYDALTDDFIQGRQIFSTAQGYYGPATAGPKGAYFAVNGSVLNESLGVVSSTGSSPGAVGQSGLTAAVTQAGASLFIRFQQPVRTSATAAITDPGSFEVVDVNTGQTRATVPALEGPSTVVTGTNRTAIGGRLLAVDASGSALYAITATGLSVISLDVPAASDRPSITRGGVVNLGTYQTAIAQNGLVSIFGQNFAASSLVAPGVPLPTVLGGLCVTVGSTALPLFAVLSGQINAQIPPEIAAGSYSLTVRAIGKSLSSSQQITVAKYAPAALVDASGNTLLFHADGKLVTRDNRASRDEPLVLYAVGLGLTTGGKVTGGAASPSSPLAAVEDVEVFFGDPTWKQAAIIVDWAGLTPGFIGLYQLNLRVPGFHISGDKLLVTIKVGSVSSPSTGAVVPYVPVE